MNERVLNSENWKLEAAAVINDIKDHVKEATLSESLRNNNQYIYINIETLESEKYCIELSANGFRICGKGYDEHNLEGDQYFETPYSLLNKVSPLFSSSFGNALLSKLNTLCQQ